MLHSLTQRASLVAAVALTASAAPAANVGLDVNSASNGLTLIYSATFDGALAACGGGSSTYCAFFGGDPGASNNVVATPTPTGVKAGTPDGIGPGGIPVAPVPEAGSYLDLALSGGNTQLTLDVSSVTFNDVDICISPGDSCAGLDAHASNAGITFSSQPAIGGAMTPAGGGSTGTVNVPVDGNGVAVFQVQNAGSVVADFSRFSQVVTSCSGSYCSLIENDVLNLDVVRYVLVVDYDPTFTSFTASFIGETQNNSLLYLTLNSASPDTDADGVADSADNCVSTANQDQADNDGDGVGNMCDNCRDAANPDQFDGDSDGFGNFCDGDFIGPAPGNGTTNAQDYSYFRSKLGTSDAAADIIHNGTVNAQDYARFRLLLGTAPGPGAGP